MGVCASKVAVTPEPTSPVPDRPVHVQANGALAAASPHIRIEPTTATANSKTTSSDHERAEAKNVAAIDYIVGSFAPADVAPFAAPETQLHELKKKEFESDDHDHDHDEIVFFLSHRGPDTKEILVRPLSYILSELGIPHFFDQSDDSMKLALTNSEQMARAAWHCRMGVVILSPHFADSKWCLRELNTFLLRRTLPLQARAQKDQLPGQLQSHDQPRSTGPSPVLLPVHFGETLYR
jgi:hypothetical protein